MMNQRAFAASLVAATALSCAAFAQTPAPAPLPPAAATPVAIGNVSKTVRDALSAADAALKSGNAAGVGGILAPVRSGTLNQSEQYLVGALLYQAGQATQNVAQRGDGIELMLASGKTPPEQQGAFYADRGQAAYQSLNYQRAEALFTQATAAIPPDPDSFAMLAEVKSQLKKPGEALTVLWQGIQNQKVLGRVVPGNWYEHGVHFAYAAKLPQQGEQIAQDWLISYPQPENWRESIMMQRELNKVDADYDVDLLRLARAAKALTGRTDYMDYAKAVCATNPGEAKAVLDEGNAQGFLGKGDDAAACAGAAAKATTAKAALAKNAKAATTAKAALAAGDAYLGFGQYAEAIPVYQAALTKTGADAGLVQTRLGIAQALAGQKDAARASFAAVTGPRASVTRYWTIWLDKGSAAAAAPAA